MTHIKNILFLCTGNSCRSQMAEAIVNVRFKDSWKAHSAGTSPAGFVHPKAIEVLEEIGIQHQGVSKHVDSLVGIEFDLVVTVCDDASENCPLWMGSGRTIHHSFPDPAQVEGSQEEILEAFRQVRDNIFEYIANLF